jgi:hypothetical protein
VAKDEEVMSMFGAYLRDLSVLVLVFFPLEMSKGDLHQAAGLVREVSNSSLALLIAGIICGKWNTVWAIIRRIFSARWREFVTHE